VAGTIPEIGADSKARRVGRLSGLFARNFREKTVDIPGDTDDFFLASNRIARATTAVNGSA
jgi:hypothetical protein